MEFAQVSSEANPETKCFAELPGDRGLCSRADSVSPRRELPAGVSIRGAGGPEPVLTAGGSAVLHQAWGLRASVVRGEQ